MHNKLKKVGSKKKSGQFDLHPKSWTKQPTIEVQIFYG